MFVFWGFFSVRLLSVLRGHSFFSSPPQRPMTSDFAGFSIPDFIHYIYFPILILEDVCALSITHMYGQQQLYSIYCKQTLNIVSYLHLGSH